MVDNTLWFLDFYLLKLSKKVSQGGAKYTSYSYPFSYAPEVWVSCKNDIVGFERCQNWNFRYKFFDVKFVIPHNIIP